LTFGFFISSMTSSCHRCLGFPTGLVPIRFQSSSFLFGLACLRTYICLLFRTVLYYCSGNVICIWCVISHFKLLINISSVEFRQKEVPYTAEQKKKEWADYGVTHVACCS
jgi:hypothetical protein